MSAAAANVLAYAVYLLTLAGWSWVIARGVARTWLVAPRRLPGWPIALSDFLLFVLLILFAWIIVPPAAGLLLKLDYTSRPVPGRTLMISGYVMNIAALAVCAAFRWHPGGLAPAGRAPRLPAAGRALVVWFLMLPVIGLATAAWNWVITALGWPVHSQEAINQIRHAASLGERVAWGVLVVGLAPVTEELIFRRGLFRFLASHLNLPLAVLLSGVIFAASHQYLSTLVPLSILGFALALVYDRTERLTAAIVLHALFNLATFISLWLEPAAT